MTTTAEPQVRLATAADFAAPAVASAGDSDPEMYMNVDPTNIKYNPMDAFLARADDPTKTFVLKTAPMRVLFPEDAGEGDLGRKITQADGKVIQQLNRGEAKFKLSVTKGGLTDAMRTKMPDLLARQDVTLTKHYQVGILALTQAFTARPKSLQDHIAKAELDAKNAAVDFETKSAARAKQVPKYTTLAALEVVMTTDAAVAAEIKAAALAVFLKSANKFDDPSEFDEEGFRQRPGKTPESVRASVKRSVWALRDRKAFNKDNMPELPTWPALPTSIANWRAILAKASANYVLNNFTYVDAASKKIIPRQKFMPPGGTDLIDDPFWSPFRGRDTLIQIEFMYQVYGFAKAYGVKAVPYATLYIVSSVKAARSVNVSASTAAVATGYTPDDDGTAEPEGEPAEPDAKKAKTDAPMPSREEEEAMAALE